MRVMVRVRVSWESDIYLKMVNFVDWLPRGGPGGVNCHTTNNHLALIPF